MPTRAITAYMEAGRCEASRLFQMSIYDVKADDCGFFAEIIFHKIDKCKYIGESWECSYQRASFSTLDEAKKYVEGFTFPPELEKDDISPCDCEAETTQSTAQETLQ